MATGGVGVGVCGRTGRLFVAMLLAAAMVCEGEERSWVAEAIAWGASQESIKLPSARANPLVRYSTPYLRVALAAQEARKQGRALEVSDLPGTAIARELHLFVPLIPAQALPDGSMVMGQVTAVTLIVGEARLQPSSLEARPLPMSVMGSAGSKRKFEGQETVAVFPMIEHPAAALAIVEYSWLDNGKTRRVERKYELELKKVKW